MPPKKKTPAAARTKAAPKPAPVRIDYPREGEEVLPGHYAVRVTAERPEAVDVEVSVDGGPWQPCRGAVGHFWYDWAPTPGVHVLSVRYRKGKFRSKPVERRSCSVREASLN